jgi:hypothetical protein
MHVCTVTEKGPNDTDASVFLGVAKRLDQNQDIGGSNVRAAVARLLRSAAWALETEGELDPEWSFHGYDQEATK